MEKRTVLEEHTPVRFKGGIMTNINNATAQWAALMREQERTENNLAYKSNFVLMGGFARKRDTTPENMKGWSG